MESVRDGAASPGPCSLGAAVSETLQPPYESLWGREGLERVQWRCMFLLCSLAVVEFYWEGTWEHRGEKKRKENCEETQTDFVRKW